MHPQAARFPADGKIESLANITPFRQHAATIRLTTLYCSPSRRDSTPFCVGCDFVFEMRFNDSVIAVKAARLPKKRAAKRPVSTHSSNHHPMSGASPAYAISNASDGAPARWQSPRNDSITSKSAALQRRIVRLSSHFTHPRVVKIYEISGSERRSNRHFSPVPERRSLEVSPL